MLQSNKGFTIVELLIVVVVIAILAAITIVAFNGIQDRAKLSALKSELSAAARSVEAFKAASSTESYPTTLDEAGVKQGSSIFLQLSADNSVSPKTFCITAVDRSKVGVAYRITQIGGVQDGQCTGHTTNPGFQNLASNSGFETSGALITTRTNLFNNPQQIASGSMGSGLTAVTGQTGFGGITTASEGYADSAWKSFAISSQMPYTGTATPVAVRFWAKANQPGWYVQNLTGNITLTASWGGVLTRLDTNQAVGDIVSDDVAREYSFTFTVPATQTTAWTFGFKHNQASATAGKRIMVTGFVGETAIAATTPFFDGTTGSQDGLSYGWTGGVNTSSSIQQGAAVSGVGSNRITSTRSTAWSAAGSASLLQTPTSVASSDNYTELLGGVATAMRVSDLKPSTQYTLMATVHVDAPLTGALNSNGSRSLFVHLNGTGITLTGNRQAPNVAGDYDLRATFTTPAAFTGYNTIRLYHGGYAGSGLLWWDKVGLVEGDYTGPYFE